MADMNAKGRHRAVRGEEVRISKLKRHDVELIRAIWAAGGVTQRQLAKRFGVGKTAIYQIVRNKTWRHLGKHPDVTI